MNPRHNIIELFSTFLQLEATTARWATDAPLRRSMKTRLATVQAGIQFEGQIEEQIEGQIEEQTGVPSGQSVLSPELSLERVKTESFWVAYWYHCWQQQQPIATQHLAAYVQESCYWAVQQTVKRFPKLPLPLPDCFQVAIAEVNTVLRRFKAERGASLKTYAEMSFGSLLRDGLRQRREVDLCTDWQLLRKSSRKWLLEALHNVGLSETAIAQYQLIWLCFQALYVPQPATGKLPKPDEALWQAIAALYSEQRFSLSSPGSSCSAATVENWLRQCALWVRQYRYPRLHSLNLPKSEQANDELQDDLIHPEEIGLPGLIAQEELQTRQAQYGQVQTILRGAIAELESEAREVLRLYYQEQKTQQQMMQQLGLSQASVSRRLKKAKGLLLTALLHWVQTSVNKDLDPDLIKEMSKALDEWLQCHYCPQSQILPTVELV
jgi:RNA polymerase sigma factor (sigma-70 family)